MNDLEQFLQNSYIYYNIWNHAGVMQWHAVSFESVLLHIKCYYYFNFVCAQILPCWGTN